MKKRLLITLMLLVAIVTGANAANYVAQIYCEGWGTDDATRNKVFDFDANETLTYTAPGASYVFVRNVDTGVQYCTDGWTNFANPVTLVNQNSLSNPGNFEKFYVPSGEHTLYLQDNGDDTFTLAYDNDIRTKTVYVYPKCVNTVGEQVVLWSWPLGDEGRWTKGIPDDIYTECFRFEIPRDHNGCVVCIIAETDPIAWDRVEGKSEDLSLPSETDGVLIVFPTFTLETLPILPTVVTTIDHLSEYLTPEPTVHDPEVAVYCDSYTWERNGQTYTMSGTYTYEAKDDEGNVTDIYTLELTIHNSTSEDRYDYAAVGSRYTKEPFDFVVEAGQDTYYYYTTNAEGCDHVITLHLTLLNDAIMDEVWNEYAYDGEVGAIYSPEVTTFKVWNPLSKSVKLNLYAKGSNNEAGAQKLGTYEMEKLMEGDKWTGIWTYMIEGDFKNKYYTYTIDGTEASDPWATTAGKDNQRSMVCDLDATDPENWTSDSHVFYEQNHAVTYINVPEFSADPMCGVLEANRGKYLALTENQTTYGNAGEVPTCMSALKKAGTKAVVIDIAAPLMMPDAYVSNPYDGNCLVNEFKQVVQAVHNTFGMSLFARLDFSTIPPYDLPYQPQPNKYIYETCLHWVNEYHVDGIVLATDLDDDTKAAVREALDAIDTRIVFGTPESLIHVHTPAEEVSENKTDPTCIEEGSVDMVVYCSVCGEELSREHYNIPALGHDYTSVVTRPTCLEAGYTTFTCSRCGDTYVSDETPALGHNPSWVTNGDVEEYKCVVCGKVLQSIMHHPEETATVCESFTWRGQTLTTSGVYTDEEKNTQGEVTDVYRLNLTINNPTTSSQDIDVYVGDHYVQEGFDFTVALGDGQKYYTTTNAAGCDSVVVLNLTVHEAETFRTDEVVEYGKSFEWRGKTYSEEGVYTDTVYTELGGVKEIYILKLAVDTTKIDIVGRTVERDDAVWNTLDGRRLDARPTRRGLYLYRGRKVVVR